MTKSWYKIDPHGSFKLGSKEFWELSKDLDSDDEVKVMILIHLEEVGS